MILNSQSRITVKTGQWKIVITSRTFFFSKQTNLEKMWSQKVLSYLIYHKVINNFNFFQKVLDDLSLFHHIMISNINESIFPHLFISFLWLLWWGEYVLGEKVMNLIECNLICLACNMHKNTVQCFVLISGMWKNLVNVFALSTPNVFYF